MRLIIERALLAQLIHSRIHQIAKRLRTCGNELKLVLHFTERGVLVLCHFLRHLLHLIEVLEEVLGLLVPQHELLWLRCVETVLDLDLERLFGLNLLPHLEDLHVNFGVQGRLWLHPKEPLDVLLFLFGLAAVEEDLVRVPLLAHDFAPFEVLSLDRAVKFGARRLGTAW